MIFSLYVNNNKKWSKLIILWIFITMAKFVTFSTPKFAVIKWDNTLLLPRQHKKKKKKKKNYGWSIEIILQVFNKLHMEVVASSKHTNTILLQSNTASKIMSLWFLNQWIRYVSTNATSIRTQAIPWSIAVPANTIYNRKRG